MSIFPNYVLNTMIVYEVALGLFALQIHDLLVAQNYLLRPECMLLVLPLVKTMHAFSFIRTNFVRTPRLRFAQKLRTS